MASYSSQMQPYSSFMQPSALESTSGSPMAASRPASDALWRLRSSTSARFAASSRLRRTASELPSMKSS